MVAMREYLTPQSSLAGTGVKGPRKLHLSGRDMQTVTVDSYIHVDRKSELEEAFFLQAAIEIKPEEYFTNHRLRRHRGFDDRMSAREGSGARQRREQVVQSRRIMGKLLSFCRGDGVFGRLFFSRPFAAFRFPFSVFVFFNDFRFR